jgi:hypothetical protein
VARASCRRLPLDFVEWLVFSTLPDALASEPLRALVESYELYAAAEGLCPMSGESFARCLAAVGLTRAGLLVQGVRIHSAIPSIRLLTRLEAYGFRFTAHDGALSWRGPEVVLGFERRVIDRHRDALVRVLRDLEEQRRLHFGASATWPHGLVARR